MTILFLSFDGGGLLVDDGVEGTAREAFCELAFLSSSPLSSSRKRFVRILPAVERFARMPSIPSNCGELVGPLNFEFACAAIS